MKINSKILLALAASVFVASTAFLIVAQKNPAPAFTASTLDGKSVAMSDLRGKVVLVNFWATSCTTCVKEMPHIAETYRKFADKGYETVAVAMSYDTPGFVAAYTLKNGLPFKVAHDANGSVAKAFGDIRLTPTTFLIDRKGNIVKRYLGEPDFVALHALIASLLAEPA